MGPSDIFSAGTSSRGIARVKKSLIPPSISIFSSVVILLTISSTRGSTSSFLVVWESTNWVLKRRTTAAASFFIIGLVQALGMRLATASTQTSPPCPPPRYSRIYEFRTAMKGRELAESPDEQRMPLRPVIAHHVHGCFPLG